MKNKSPVQAAQLKVDVRRVRAMQSGIRAGYPMLWSEGGSGGSGPAVQTGPSDSGSHA
jgi:hypothetical protein